MFTPERIREIRAALDLSAREFAKLLGVTDNTVWKWEAGDRHPSYRHMTKLDKLSKRIPAMAGK